MGVHLPLSDTFGLVPVDCRGSLYLGQPASIDLSNPNLVLARLHRLQGEHSPVLLLGQDVEGLLLVARGNHALEEVSANRLGSICLYLLGECYHASERALGVACQCIVPCRLLRLVDGSATWIGVLDYNASMAVV